MDRTVLDRKADEISKLVGVTIFLKSWPNGWAVHRRNKDDSRPEMKKGLTDLELLAYLDGLKEGAQISKSGA